MITEIDNTRWEFELEKEKESWEQDFFMALVFSAMFVISFLQFLFLREAEGKCFFILLMFVCSVWVWVIISGALLNRKRKMIEMKGGVKNEN